MTYSTFHLHTPIGWLQITDNGRAITQICVCPEITQANPPCTPLQTIAYRQISDYFYGRRLAFDIPIEPQGTAFMQRVWHELRNIPYGHTRSYSDIAHCIGNPRAARAVGNACNKNPLLLLIPCHRVVGKNHQLTGFAAGIACKQTLLQLEQHFIEKTCDTI